MEDNRNWQGWAALALAGLALAIALFGHNAPPVTVAVYNGPTAAQPAAPSIPFQRAQPLPPNGPRQPMQPGFGPGFSRNFGPGFQGGQQRGPWANRPDVGDRRGFGGHGWHRPFFFGPIFMLFGLVRLAGLVLLGWLAFKFFQARRDRPTS